jgi:hypothetical protein
MRNQFSGVLRFFMNTCHEQPFNRIELLTSPDVSKKKKRKEAICESRMLTNRYESCDLVSLNFALLYESNLLPFLLF